MGGWVDEVDMCEEERQRGRGGAIHPPTHPPTHTYRTDKARCRSSFWCWHMVEKVRKSICMGWVGGWMSSVVSRLVGGWVGGWVGG